MQLLSTLSINSIVKIVATPTIAPTDSAEMKGEMPAAQNIVADEYLYYKNYISSYFVSTKPLVCLLNKCSSCRFKDKQNDTHH